MNQSINYEERCVNFIRALFRLQDQWKKESATIGKGCSFVERVEGPEEIFIIRDRKSMRIGWIEDGTMHESKHYIRMKEPDLITDVPMMLTHYLIFLKQYQKGAAA